MIYLIYAFVSYIVAVIVYYRKKDDVGEAIFIGVCWPVTLPFFILKLLVEWGTVGLAKSIKMFWVCWGLITTERDRETTMRSIDE